MQLLRLIRAELKDGTEREIRGDRDMKVTGNNEGEKTELVREWFGNWLKMWGWELVEK